MTYTATSKILLVGVRFTNALIVAKNLRTKPVHIHEIPTLSGAELQKIRLGETAPPPTWGR